MWMIEKLKYRLDRWPKLRVDKLALYLLYRAVTKCLVAQDVIDVSGRLVRPRFEKGRFIKPPTTFTKLVSVGGFGWSGSSAVTELLSEYEGVTADYAGLPSNVNLQLSKKCFEFELCRGAGGLFSLEKAFETHNFMERDAAVRLFLELANYLYLNVRSFYGEEFIELTAGFLNQLIAGRAVNGGGFDYCHQLEPLGHAAVHRFLGCPDEPNKEFMYYLKNLTIREYRELAHGYLQKLLRLIVTDDWLVLDQATSDATFDIDKYRTYFGPIKNIFVWRDPREVYAASQMYAGNQAFFPKDPNEFVVVYRDTISRALAVKDPDFLTVHFDSLLYHYDQEIARIEAFLGLTPGQHVRKQTRFVPEQSIARSIGHWQRYPDQACIAIIQSGLQEFCGVSPADK